MLLLVNKTSNSNQPMSVAQVSLIVPGLYQGGFVDLDTLPDVDVVVNVCELPDAPAQNKELCAVLWSPVPDACYPGHAWLDMVADYILHCYRQQWTVYVHCLCGVSRSSLVNCAVLMKLHGWGWKDAMRFLQSRHSAACPNHLFVAGLHTYEQHLLPAVDVRI